MEEILAIKVVFIFVMLVSAFLAGLIPLYSKAFQNNKRLISFGNCFAAGIFILVGLVHLLKESQEAFAEATEDEELPLGYIVSVAGYAIMLFIENILFGGHKHHEEEDTKSKPKTDFPISVQIEGENNYINSMNSEHQNHIGNDNIISKNVKDPDNVIDNTPGIILTAALVIHSIFEGIAVGLLDTKTSVVMICIAVLLHNIPAAMALGIKLKHANRKLAFFMMVIFVSASPLGIAIGISLSDLAYPLVRAIFLSISAGTFLYIGCTEIIAEEMEEKSNRLIKFAGFVLGFFPLSMLAVFIHEH